MAAIGTPGIGSPDFDAKAEFRDKVWRLITLIPACHFTTTEHIANAVNCETIIVNDLLKKAYLERDDWDCLHIYRVLRYFEDGFAILEHRDPDVDMINLRMDSIWTFNGVVDKQCEPQLWDSWTQQELSPQPGSSEPSSGVGSPMEDVMVYPEPRSSEPTSSVGSPLQIEGVVPRIISPVTPQHSRFVPPLLRPPIDTPLPGPLFPHETIAPGGPVQEERIDDWEESQPGFEYPESCEMGLFDNKSRSESPWVPSPYLGFSMSPSPFEQHVPYEPPRGLDEFRLWFLITKIPQGRFTAENFIARAMNFKTLVIADYLKHRSDAANSAMTPIALHRILRDVGGGYKIRPERSLTEDLILLRNEGIVMTDNGFVWETSEDRVWRMWTDEDVLDPIN